MTENRSFPMTFVIAILFAWGWTLYGLTLHAPWQLDDYSNIVLNHDLRDLGLNLRRILLPRGIGMVSFALDYNQHRLQLPGYHLVNITLHIVNSLLAFCVLRRIFASKWLQLFGALLFLSHPLQTQGVTYIVQRYNLFAALFGLISLLLFIRAREHFLAGERFGAPRHLLPYAGALVAGLLAVLSKQNAAVLPLLLFIFARFFIPGERSVKGLLLYLLPFVFAPAAVAASQLLVPLSQGAQLGSVSGVSSADDGTALPPGRYFAAELPVLLLYLKLLFVPWGQALDYGFPVYPPLDPVTLISAAVLALIGWLAWRGRNRYPHLSFGYAWFLTALAVESTFIPLDLVFEHRLYFPLFGFAVAVVGALQALPVVRLRHGISIVILIVISILTWRRNLLWTDPVAFAEDNLRRAPNAIRPYVNLGKRYIDAGRSAEAKQVLEDAMHRGMRDETIYINLSKLYADEGRIQDALRMAEEGLRRYPDNVMLTSNAGVIFDLAGKREEAAAAFFRATVINPRHAETWTNWGALLAGEGRWEEAAAKHREAVRVEPEYAQGHYNLGVALYNLKRLREALQEFDRSTSLDPKDADSWYNLAAVAAEVREEATYRLALSQLRLLRPDRAAALEKEHGALR